MTAGKNPGFSLFGAFQARLEQWTAEIGKREEQLYLFLSIVIGAVVGAAVVAFILLSERLGHVFLPTDSSLWRRLLVPMVTTLVTGYLLYRFAPEARGSGVPQTKAALFAQRGFIPMKAVLAKFFLTSATLASGVPLGREGPSVQVGAGIASVVARRLGFSEARVKSLLPVGVAAAIAAAFNTPLAAVLFTLEELMGDLHAPVLGSVVLSSATSWMVLRLLLGNEPLFHVPEYHLVHPLEFLFYALLGILGGLLSAAFVKSLLKLRDWFLSWPVKSQAIQPAIGGLLVGLLAFIVPQVLGVGYTYVGDALNGKMLLQVMALLIALKFVAVIVSYASGNAGGIFGPSLFLGAMLGGTFGTLAHNFFPGHTGEAGAYALVGMGALFAGIIRAPMTSVIMIFETTHDYAIIVPVMIANLASFFISRRLQHQPIYEALALQEGIHLPSSESHERKGRFLVRHAMTRDFVTLDSNAPAGEAYQQARASGGSGWPVTDERGVIGMVARGPLESAATTVPQQRVRTLLVPGFPHVHEDQPLDLALERMGASRLDTLPVVSRTNAQALLGVVTLPDVLRMYKLNF